MRTQSIITILVVLGLMLGTSGCIPVAYVYPKVETVSTKIPDDFQSLIEPVRYETPSKEAGDVTAFLIRRTSNNQSPFWSSQRTISTIPIGMDGTVSKSRFTIETSITLYSPLTYGYECKHDMSLVLFRPGFKTVDVSESNDNLIWQPVTSYAEYEQSIDHIVLSGAETNLPSFGSPFNSDPDFKFTYGIRGERESLLRLAAEYSRLLELVRQDESQSPMLFDEQLSIRTLQQENKELAAIQRPSDSEGSILDWKREQLEFETRWIDTINRLELKIAWLEARADATSKMSLPFRIML